jgi:peptidoglycan/LPS O-acetylase OafA/YrhL
MTAPPPPRPTYRPELDGFRGFAFLTVMGFHTAFVVPALRPYFGGGFIGVDIFFVLSGMLITEWLIAEHLTTGRIRLGSFFIRRFRRLLPALVAFVIVSTGYYSVSRHKGRAALHSYVSIARLVETGHPTSHLVEGLSQMWTLVVEWDFYLIWPVVLVILLRLRIPLRTLGWLTLSAAILITVVRAGVFRHDGGDVNLSFFLAWLRFDELLLGCAIGLFSGWLRVPNWLRTVAVIGLLAVLKYGALTDRWVYLGGIMAIAVATATIITPRTTPWWFDRVWRNGFLVWVGQASYSLYLWNEPVTDEVAKHGYHWSVWVRLAVSVGGTLVLAIASNRLVEHRFRTPLRRRQPAAAAADST